ncbi:hypothetical protein BC829DRAFT_379311 [Chytridium lagenaria]|nr:hypothetical protein BC829DRAFT_379311 [Chytridium lagenaria]
MVPLWPTFAFCFGWNALGFSISALVGTEKFYDMFGTSTFALSAFYTFGRMMQAAPKPVSIHVRQLFLFVNTLTWSARLFAFLSYRVHLLKGDRRFDKIKNNPVRFAFAWTMQAIWAGVVGYPAYVVLSMEFDEMPNLGFWILSGCKTVADIQKLNWQKKERDARFKSLFTLVCGGTADTQLLWRNPSLDRSISLAISAFPGSVNAYLKLSISPLLIAYLLTGLSGIPLQEKQAKVRFEGNEEYAKYVASTSVLVPWTPGYTPPKEKKDN